MSIYNTETEKTIFCKPGHESCSVKSGAVDPLNKYVATTGTDGFLKIYKFADDHSSVKFLSKIKICEKKVSSDRTFNLDIQWLEDGESIIVTGNAFCGFV
jgi:WD40 repeat protein